VSRLQIRPEAEVDALEASIWYEGETTGLGNEFLEDLRRTLARIETGPGQFPLVSDAVRRAILRRFPFGVFFTLERDVATVVAIVHLHRHPTTWQGRS
jgi:hypothetical protein